MIWLLFLSTRFLTLIVMRPMICREIICSYKLTASVKELFYGQHIMPLLDHVIELGKRPALWGDVLLQYPELLQDIPQETVVFTWNYNGVGAVWTLD